MTNNHFIPFILEYCAIPVGVWGITTVVKLFFIKIKKDNNEHNEEEEEDLFSSGYEFVLIESLSYLTMFIRLYSDGKKVPATWCLSICLMELALFVRMSLSDKSFMPVNATRFRTVMWLFYISIYIRIIISAFANGVLDTSILKYTVNDWLLITLPIVFFFTIYTKFIEIYCVTWERFNSEKTSLFNLGKYWKVRRIALRFFYSKVFKPNVDGKKSYQEGVRVFGESALCDKHCFKPVVWFAAYKLKKIVCDYHGKKRDYDLELYVKILAGLYCKLNMINDAENIINLLDEKEGKIHYMKLLKNRDYKSFFN